MLGNLFNFQSKGKEGKKKSKGKKDETENTSEACEDNTEDNTKVVKDVDQKKSESKPESEMSSKLESKLESKSETKSETEQQKFLELAKKIETLQNEAQRRSHMWTSFSNEKADLENELQTLRKENKSLKDQQMQSQEAQSDAASLQSALAAERRSNADLAEKLRLEHLKNERLHNDLCVLTQNKDADSIIDLVTTKTVDLCDELNKLASEADAMAAKLGRSSGNVDNEMMADLARAWTQASHAVRNRAETIVQRIEALEKALKETQKPQMSEEESKTLTNLVERTQQRLEAERAKVGELEARIKEMQNQLDAVPILKAQVDIYRSDFDAERAAREKIAGEKADLEEELRKLKEN